VGSIRRQFLSFAVVGVAGFIVDTIALYAALGLGLGLYGGRAVSFLVAATFTWAMNRRFTFPARDRERPARQWLKFLAANSLGAVVNYGLLRRIGDLEFAGRRMAGVGSRRRIDRRACFQLHRQPTMGVRRVA
jgi:putative flippase GtrA